MTRRPFIDRARERATRRKSRWNIVLFALAWPLFVGVWFLLIQFTLCVQQFIAPDKVFNATMSDPGETLMTVPLLFPAFPIGMMAANCVMWCIPPARRAFANESEGHTGTDFASSMKPLAMISAVCLIVAIPLAILGAFDPF